MLQVTIRYKDDDPVITVCKSAIFKLYDKNDIDTSTILDDSAENELLIDGSMLTYIFFKGVV